MHLENNSSGVSEFSAETRGNTSFRVTEFSAETRGNNSFTKSFRVIEFSAETRGNNSFRVTEFSAETRGNKEKKEKTKLHKAENARSKDCTEARKKTDKQKREFMHVDE